MVYRVFLSSTSKDLAAYREAVLAAIAGLDGFEPIAMENFGARAAAAADFDDRAVREGDVLVGLLGLCYGSSPRDGPPSFTEPEYDSAVASGVDRLMLVSPANFPVPGHLIEPDEQRQRQQAFRTRVKTDLIAEVSKTAFASPAALASAVTRALANWRAEREKAEEIVAELVATKADRDRYEARAAELERALAEGQKEREALRAAVMALTSKAHDPKPSPGVERALGLLREGQTAAAQAIFAEVIERKEKEGVRKQAEGTTAFKEAAAAARHLGALAYLDSTQKAIGAYTTATRLDPDDTWSWILLGRLYQQAGKLAAAEQAFEKAREAAVRVGNERAQSVARLDEGDIRLARGNLAEALAAYQEAIGIHQRLAAHDPSNTQWQRDFAVSLHKIADVQRARGNLDAALEAYQDSLAITEKLAAQDPINAEWQRDLAVSFNTIGDVQRARGDLKAALEANQYSLAITEKLAAQDPSNTEWQRDLAATLDRISDVHSLRGNLDAAFEACRDALAIAKKLGAWDPSNSEWQRDLSVSHALIGTVLEALGDLEGALNQYDKTLQIQKRLTVQDPRNAECSVTSPLASFRLATCCARGAI